MLTTIVTRVVAASCRHAKLVVLIAALAAGLACYYTATHFAINTDSSKLIAEDLPWRQRQAEFNKAFPQNEGLILAVVDAQTPEQAQSAAASLVDRLKDRHDQFDFVKLPDEEPFFAKNGLLFQPTEKVQALADQLTKSRPLLGQLAFDPSLRGFMTMISMISIGVERGQIPLAQVAPFFGQIADTTEGALDGHEVPFSFQQLISGGEAGPEEAGKRRFVMIKPKLDFGNIEPGQAATDTVRQAIDALHLTKDHGVTVRLTGQIPLDDQEFGTVKEGFALNSAITVLAVVFILWLALKSGRLILAVGLSTFVGLALTGAAGLAAVGALNLISIAFAVLFIGIGVDFGIQFSVRYRDERYSEPNLITAVTTAGTRAGRPLMLAGATTAAGFYSFLPTDYKGISELGLIAGNGMIIAFTVSITLLPALLTLFHPPSETKEVGYSFLAPLDNFLTRHRWWVIGLTVGLALVGSPLLGRVTFDFNPLNLNSPKVEAVSTLLDLMKNPATTSNKIDVLEPSLERAQAMADRIAKLPEVGGTQTLNSFVPPGQPEKLPVLQDLADELDPALNPPSQKPAPTDAEDVTSIKAAADRLDHSAQKGTGEPAQTTRRLADDLRKLAGAPPQARVAASNAFVPPMHMLLDQLRGLISAQAVTLDNLPKDLVRNWVSPDGQARVEVTPKNLSNSNENLKAFGDAVLSVAPDATGEPIIIKDSGNSVIQAFMEAGLWALGSITLLLFIVLRRIGDVLLTLVPLLLAGILTMEITVLIGLPLNFANIIALPLLLGLGVAFKIYFVMAWRAGQTHLLQSSLTRAVFFSAMTTAVAFGSLWSSNHPGTASMGELLTLSLACTMLAAVFFQPALMGPPREKKDSPVAEDGKLREGVPVAAE